MNIKIENYYQSSTTINKFYQVDTLNLGPQQFIMKQANQFNPKKGGNMNYYFVINQFPSNVPPGMQGFAGFNPQAQTSPEEPSSAEAKKDQDKPQDEWDNIVAMDMFNRVIPEILQDSDEGSP